MKIRVNVISMGLVLVCLAAANGWGQDNSNATGTSLGDIARQMRAQKAKDSKPAKVITTDTITQKDDDASGLNGGGKEKPTESTAEGSGPKREAHDEMYYRSKMSTLQGNLNTHQRELDVLQQKLGQNQNQYYADPNKSLLQQYSRDDIDKLTADIDAKKGQIADDQKAMDDLRDQLRHEGGDPGWLR